ncbi:MAG: S8 family serine peptidase [Acidimicrobiales bacterium]
MPDRQPGTRLPGARVLGAALLAVVLTAPAAGAGTGQPEAPPSEVADPSLGPAAAIGPDVAAAVERTGRADVIIEFRATGPSGQGGSGRLSRHNTARLEQLARQLEIREIEPLATRRPLAVASVDRRSLASLGRSDQVVRVLPNRRHRIDSLTSATTTVRAPDAWSAGTTGAGQRIAIVDTGVDATHPFLGGRVEKEVCFSGGSTDPQIMGLCWPNSTFAEGPSAAAPCAALKMIGAVVPTECDHGTHVAGIAAGASGPPAARSGIAPGASLLAVQVFTADLDPNRCGGVAPCLVTFDADLLAALDWVTAEQLSVPNIAAVNLSLGGRGSGGYCDTDPLKPSIDALAALGVTTVAASGNSGSKTRVASPACISTVLAVGAVDDSTGTVPWFSQSGTALDLLAPGVDIVSSVPGGGYARWSGTSMAAPFVSGALALLQQARGPLSVLVEERLLKRNGQPITDGSRVTPMVRIDRILSDQPGIGSIDSAGGGPGSISAAGWGLDLDTVAAIRVQVLVDGVIQQTVTAGLARPDVEQAFPGYGSAHGWQLSLTGISAGPRQVCVQALNETGSALFPGTSGTPALIGCRTVTVPGGNPFGTLDSAIGGPASITTAGWAIDPDTTNPVQIHLYVDGIWRAATTANLTRPDVGAAYPAYGNNHGWHTTIGPLSPGQRQLCAYAINQATGTTNPLIGCRTVTVPGG